jgi:putative spermidine/putrescine transport system substrate-binding protein
MEFVVPKEGAYVITNYVGVVKKAPNSHGAQQWAQFRLGQQAMQAVADGVNYGPTNSKVQLPDNIASRVIYGPEQAAKLQQIDWVKFADLRPSIAERIVKQIEPIH